MQRAYIVMIMSAAFWGFQPVCIKWLSGIWSAPTITVVRYFAIAAILMVATCRSEKHFLPRGQEWLRLPLMGLMGVTLNNILQFTGIPYTTVTNCTLISATTPAITGVISAVFLGERLAGKCWLGIVMAFAGVLMIIMHGDIQRLLELSFGFGDVLCFFSQVSWAVYALIGADILKHRSPLSTTAWSGAFGCIFTLIYGETTGTMTFVPLELKPALSMAYIILLGGLFCMVFWNVAVRAVGASHTAIFLNIMPVAGMISGAVLFNESIGAVQLLGAAVILIGVYLTSTN